MIFKIEYWHDSLQIGNIPANSHMWMYLDASIGAPVETIEEEGIEDGYKNFTPTFQKSTKTYRLETNVMPEHMVDAIHRMKYFNHKQITMQNGDIEQIKNVKTSVDYPFDSTCLSVASIEFDIDEVIVITDC
jgi:hypothetical protein